jgi:hypothetical protein
MWQLKEFLTGSGLESEHRSLGEGSFSHIDLVERNWRARFVHWHCIVESSSKHRVNNYIPAEQKSITTTLRLLLWIIGLGRKSLPVTNLKGLVSTGSSGSVSGISTILRS